MSIEEVNNNSNKIIIAVDLDEVLGYFIESLCVFHNEVYGTNYTIDSFFSYNFVDVWGGSVDETFDKMNLFFESHHFSNISPVSYAYETLLRLTDRFDFHIVTARQHFLEDKTRAFIDKYYPNIFKSITFCNHYNKVGKKLTKLSVCQSLGAQLLIDDSYSYVKECVDNGLCCILKGNYAWNSNFNIKKYILKKSGEDIKEFDHDLYDEELNLVNFSINNYNKEKLQIYRANDWLVIEKFLNYHFFNIYNNDDY